MDTKNHSKFKQQIARHKLTLKGIALNLKKFLTLVYLLI